ncbi:Histone deacetylase 14 [Bienertia sinuspersici]
MLVLQPFTPSLSSQGYMLPLFEHSLCTLKDPLNLGSFFRHARQSSLKNLMSGRKSSISCSNNLEKEPSFSSDINLANAKVIYSVAPASGHNKEAHPESNLRVPAIIDALEKMELTPKLMLLLLIGNENEKV